MGENPVYYVLFADLLAVPEPRPVGIKSKAPLKNDDNKYMTRIVRFNNNLFTELTQFRTVLDGIIADPMLLSWIDLSFNTLPKIDEVSELYVNLPAEHNLSPLSMLTVRIADYLCSPIFPLRLHNVNTVMCY